MLNVMAATDPLCDDKTSPPGPFDGDQGTIHVHNADCMSVFTGIGLNIQIIPIGVDKLFFKKVRLLLEEILWDKKYDMDLYRCKDV
ncbi:hypothetical protein Tco_0750443 [Tanacetum coccineum]|uniref:Uncharacterized protein n=1 Tax=Tanacetum coccineum TaxID=301880 RepID=A0ABQ4Z416_9ASTR